MYAEDPFRKFLPSTGPLVTYCEPTVTRMSGDVGGGGACGGGVRVDSGVVEGSTVSMFYDPMISKLVAFGDTRGDALKRLGTALDGEGWGGRGVRGGRAVRFMLWIATPGGGRYCCCCCLLRPTVR